MNALTRRGRDCECPGCGRPQLVLLPEAECGSEFLWTARCGGCGDWRWFHARLDADFVRSIVETAKARGEPGGLSEEGTREAHARYEALLGPCACGGRFHVVRTLDAEPCLGCGRPLGTAAGGTPRSVVLAPLRG